jgi:hypothetical protein
VIRRNEAARGQVAIDLNSEAHPAKHHAARAVQPQGALRERRLAARPQNKEGGHTLPQ